MHYNFKDFYKASIKKINLIKACQDWIPYYVFRYIQKNNNKHVMVYTKKELILWRPSKLDFVLHIILFFKYCNVTKLQH